MELQSFLTVDGKPLSLQQSLMYLRATGRLDPFISDILRQYVTEQEIKQREDVAIEPGTIEQSIIDFRLENQLTDSKTFQDWLNSNGLDFSTFHAQVTARFQQEKLKEVVTKEKLSEYFIERKIFLDRVVLSRIVVEQQELAAELYSQLTEEEASFEELAEEYSLAEESVAGGMMGPVSKGTLPEELRAFVDAAIRGTVLQPLELEEKWCIFRVGKLLETSLENQQVQQILREELFDKWLGEQIQNMQIQVQVN